MPGVKHSSHSEKYIKRLYNSELSSLYHKTTYLLATRFVSGIDRYSQTCIKRPLRGECKSGLLQQVVL